MRLAVCLTLGLAAPASAELDMQSLRYACDRGVEVPVTYVNGAEGSVVVLNVEGQQISLVSDAAASGARYGWPSGGSSYVWWSKGETATLYWRDGAAGTETAVLKDCRTKE
ncbi:MAG: MliC family protein [Gemmobacter sp.]